MDVATALRVLVGLLIGGAVGAVVAFAVTFATGMEWHTAEYDAVVYSVPAGCGAIGAIAAAACRRRAEYETMA